jgi:uncharacterized membrane protein YoaK (UPF0700 family)
VTNDTAVPGSRPAFVPVALSLIAGVTDVTSWLLLGGFFSAHVTGNLVVLAADSVDGRAPSPAAVLAIPVFIVVSAVATVFAGRAGATPSRTGVYLLTAQAVLLMAAAVLSFTTVASADPGAPLAVIVGLLAVAAMAAQNAYLHLTPGPAATTAVMTGNLVTATVSGVQVVRSRGADAAARAKWRASWPLIAGFVVGCLIGAAGATLIGDHAAVVPAVLALALLVALASLDRRRSASDASPLDSPRRHG